ncbi:MAG: hypothetical protein JWM27_4848 [Gemmatimonadetes bacterium]|nr:hypothetical protein [Gemmatimonadota bacterium]
MPDMYEDYLAALASDEGMPDAPETPPPPQPADVVAAPEP